MTTTFTGRSFADGKMVFIDEAAFASRTTSPQKNSTIEQWWARTYRELLGVSLLEDVEMSTEVMQEDGWRSYYWRSRALEKSPWPMEGSQPASPGLIWCLTPHYVARCPHEHHGDGCQLD
jgi:hypothetical protein